MASGFDKVFGVHEASLSVHSRRLQVLSNNIANADTPGYKARDIDFRAAMQHAVNDLNAKPSNIPASGNRGTDQASSASHSNTGTGMRDYYTPVQYRVPLQPDTGDQNSVDSQTEMAQYAQSAQHYQTSLTFMSGKIRSLLTAIKGE